MITKVNARKLLEQLNQNFPQSKPKTNPNEDGSLDKLTLNVSQIDEDQLWHLARMTGEAEAKVILKRSGTGISINFN